MNRLLTRKEVAQEFENHMRGTGRTSAQMREAPEGAYFIVPRGAVEYSEMLKHHLGRADLKIETMEFVRGERYRGTGKPIVFDHWIEPRGVSELAAIETARIHNELLWSKR